MRILIIMLAIVGFSLPGLAQTSLRDQKIIYAQTRCQELQEAQLLGDSRKKENWKGCISYFEEYFGEIEYGYRGKNILVEEYKNINLEAMCRHVEIGRKYYMDYWFGKINTKDVSQAYNDCLAFYNSKKVSSPGNPTMISDDIDF